jgi:SAM-dependent methyltransferase
VGNEERTARAGDAGGGMTTFAPAYLGPRYRADAPLPELSPAQSEVRRRLLAQGAKQDWEERACLCGAQDGRILTEVDRYGLPYRKVLCSRCGLMRVTPRWTAARYARFYQEHYRDLYSPLSTEAGEETLLSIARGPSAAMIGKFVEGAWTAFGDPSVAHPTIVEIGAGGGWNLSRLSARWNRIGYDSDERFLALGRSAFGLDMRMGFLQEALPSAAEADCVLLSHVLEHIPDPVETLVQLRRAARPNALILVEVPGIFRLHKTSLDPMRYWQNAHTFTFCARTLADTCRRAGLEPLSIDEWIHLVLRPSQDARVPVEADPTLAKSIERYLRYCEQAYRLSDQSAHLPLVGRAASLAVRRVADGVVRMAGHAGLVRGMRVPAPHRI